jgi:hypothetical protein
MLTIQLIACAAMTGIIWIVDQATGPFEIYKGSGMFGVFYWRLFELFDGHVPIPNPHTFVLEADVSFKGAVFHRRFTEIDADDFLAVENHG